MQKVEFELQGEYIELLQLLKALGIAETGGHAKIIVEDEQIFRNGELELRKRAKIRKGEKIQIGADIYVEIL